MSEDGASERYRALLESLPAISYIADLEGLTTIYTSPQIERLFGFTLAEWVADPGLFPRQLHPEDRDWVLAAHHRCRDTGEPLHAEYRVLAKGGRVVWVVDVGVVVRDDSGRPRHLHGVMLDVTNRRQERPGVARTGRHLAEEIVRALEAHGLPAGITLLEVARVRHALQEADRLLHRLEEAIVRTASEAL